MTALFGTLVFGALFFAGKAVTTRYAEASMRRLATVTGSGSLVSKDSVRVAALRWQLRKRAIATGGVSLIGAAVGWRLAGPPGSLVGASCGLVAWRWSGRLAARRRRDALEAQLADLVEAWALAIRSGLSIPQALEFAARDAQAPLDGIVHEFLARQRMGIRFETALRQFEESIGNQDARLLVLVTLIHHRSGGDLAAALEQVAETIRYRVAARRELRAFTAQGRTSAVILGSLPLVFFFFLVITSSSELAAVYRSPSGVTMMATGLLLEAVAYLWIRRLLRIRL